MNTAIFLKSSLPFYSSYLSFLFINKALRVNELKTTTALKAKISVFICVEAIRYLLLYNLHDCTFSDTHMEELLPY